MTELQCKFIFQVPHSSPTAMTVFTRESGNSSHDVYIYRTERSSWYVAAILDLASFRSQRTLPCQ